MRHLTSRLACAARCIFAGHGRHRAQLPERQDVNEHQEAYAAHVYSTPAPPPEEHLLDGAATRLVRPYVLPFLGEAVAAV